MTARLAQSSWSLMSRRYKVGGCTLAESETEFSKDAFENKLNNPIMHYWKLSGGDVDDS